MDDADLTTRAAATRTDWIACLPLLLLAVGILMTGYLKHIAPAIKNELFYAVLAAGAGYVIAAMGGGSAAPLRDLRKRISGSHLTGNAVSVRTHGTKSRPGQGAGRNLKTGYPNIGPAGGEQNSFPQRMPFCPRE